MSTQQIASAESHIATQPVFSASASRRVLECKELTSWYGTAHNTALAAAAAVETGDDEEVSDHIAELTQSPMFRLLTDEYERGLKGDTLNDPGFHLAMFAARAFLAGTLYAKPSSRA